MFKPFLLLLTACLFFTQLSAQKPVIDPAPEWLVSIHPDYSKKPPEKEISDGYYLDLSDRQINVPRQTTYVHITRKIVNENGVQAASEVSVNYSPEFQRLVFHYIRLVRDGKVVNNFRSAEIKVVHEETEADEYLYDNEKRAYIILEDTRKGDQIDFAYSIIGFNPVFKNKFAYTQYLTASSPITNFYLSVLSNPEKKLNLHLFNNAVSPAITTHQSLTLHQWNQSALKAWVPNTGAPSWFDNEPYFTLTEYNNWKEVTDWAIETFKYYKYPLSAALQKKVAEIRAVAKNDQDLFTEMVIRYVQNQVRYLGFEEGTYSHQPHDPNQVFRQGFGDCKDKSLLLVRILQEANIKAYVAMLNTSLGDKVDKEAPSPRIFNHAIVAIERSGGNIFIDPTMNNQWGSLINFYIPAYGKALLIKEQNDVFDIVNPGFINKTKVEEILDVKAKGGGNSKLQVKTVYAGGAADFMRDYFASNSLTDTHESYEKYYKTIYDSIVIDGDITFTDDTNANEITVNENYIINDIWHLNDEGKDELSLFAKAIYDKISSLKDHSDKIPLAISYPLDLDYSLKVVMPEPWNFPLKPVNIKTTAYEFSYTPSNFGNEIDLKYRYKTFKDNIPAEDLQAYKSDYPKIEKTLEYVLYKTNETTANRGSGSVGDQVIYWPFVLLTMIIGVMMFFLLNRHNKMRVAIAVPAFPAALNGWTLLLGISIFVSLGLQLYSFFSDGYLSMNSFKNIREYDSPGLYNTWVIELVVHVIVISLNIAATYWFVKRRDIFPEFFIFFLIAIFITNLVLLTAYNVFHIDQYIPDATSSVMKDLARNIIYGLIWGTYIRRSQNVRDVFVNPPEQSV